MKPYKETSFSYRRSYSTYLFLFVKGGKDGNLPNMATIFFETRKTGNELVEPETNEKYAEIQELVQFEPSLTNIDAVERCFGPQCKSYAVGFGGGITTKDLKGGITSKAVFWKN
nr:uncharacterized protein LOC109120748 [Solanum lycopersicum]